MHCLFTRCCREFGLEKLPRVGASVQFVQVAKRRNGGDPAAPPFPMRPVNPSRQIICRVEEPDAKSKVIRVVNTSNNSRHLIARASTRRESTAASYVHPGIPGPTCTDVIYVKLNASTRSSMVHFQKPPEYALRRLRFFGIWACGTSLSTQPFFIRKRCCVDDCRGTRSVGPSL
jgi:hypothetical protein